MSNILDQIKLYKEALGSDGNIIKKNNAVDEDSDEDEESDASFD